MAATYNNIDIFTKRKLKKTYDETRWYQFFSVQVKPWVLIDVVQLFTGHEIFTNGPWYLHEMLKKESLSMNSTYVLLKSIVQW